MVSLYQEHQSHVLLVYLLALVTNARYLAAGQPHAEVAAPALALQVLGAGLYAAGAPLARRPWARPLSLVIGAGGGALCCALSLVHVHALLACTVAVLNAHALVLLNIEIWLQQDRECVAAATPEQSPQTDNL